MLTRETERIMDQRSRGGSVRGAIVTLSGSAHGYSS